MADYNKLTVAQLKEELKKRGLTVSGRKAELVDRLQESDQPGKPSIDGEGAPTEANEAAADTAAAEQQKKEPEEAANVDAVQDGDKKATDGDQSAQPGSEARQEHSEEDELSLGDSDEEEDTEAANDAAKGKEEEQPVEMKEETPQPAAAEPQADEKVHEQERGSEPVKEQSPELQREASKGRFKPITFPSDTSPGSGAAPSSRSQRASSQEATKNNVNTATPVADVRPAEGSGKGELKSTPARRRCSTELSTKQPAAASNAVGTNGAAEQSGSKRKRPVIVFDPQPSAPTDSPPQKRDKVELVVGVATEVTCALRINGLKRPLREADLKAILEETGHVKGFWIDSCKTHCYVVYSTLEEAQASYAALDGREWPPKCKSVMKPTYVTPEEANGMIDSRGNATLRRVGSAAADDEVDVVNVSGDGDRGEQGEPGGRRGGERGAPIERRVSDARVRRSTEEPDRMNSGAEGVRKNARRRMSNDEPGPVAGNDVIDMADASDGQDNAAAEAGVGEDEDMQDVEEKGRAVAAKEPEAPAPTSLFKLTSTQPALYWLPLGEEEVQRLREVSEARKASQELRSGGAAAADSGGGAGPRTARLRDGGAQEVDTAQVQRESVEAAEDSEKHESPRGVQDTDRPVDEDLHTGA